MCTIQAHRRAGDALLALGRGEAAARSMAKAAALEHVLEQKGGKGGQEEEEETQQRQTQEQAQE